MKNFYEYLNFFIFFPSDYKLAESGEKYISQQALRLSACFRKGKYHSDVCSDVCGERRLQTCHPRHFRHGRTVVRSENHCLCVCVYLSLPPYLVGLPLQSFLVRSAAVPAQCGLT